MKTIDINLIGSEIKVLKKVTTVEEIDGKARTFAVVAVAGASLACVVGAGIWLVAYSSTDKMNTELTELSVKQEQLNEELAESTQVLNNLKDEKRILELKLVVQDQVKNYLVPWQSILCDIAGAVPKDLKITRISKSGSKGSKTKDTSSVTININGQVGAKKTSGTNPLTAISFFALNINENSSPNSYLSNAVIRSVEFNEENGLYNFAIETKLQAPDKKIKNKESKDI